ncbi:MAG TPA: S41 family peptidase [Gemmatimonadales bacterium]
MRLLIFALMFAFPSPSADAAAQQSGALGLYRYPALRGDVLVFAAEGDLWTVSADGGVARRLTTHAAEETNPVISPDGTTLAFTARYEGPAELYTMPIGGGVPTRWTYEGDASVATAWSPDGRLVYTTRHYNGLPKPQLVQLDLRDGTRSLIPLADASEVAFDGTAALYFVRPAYHNNVTKRYTGGTARDVWRFAQGAEEAVELTGSYDGESHSPMTWNGRVYFVSDRDGTMNLWSMAATGGDLRQHTRHSGWDVKNPALSDGRIVYQLGADLWRFDVASNADRRLAITLVSDFDQLREKWVTNPMDYLTSAHLDPAGERVVLTARGRVFVAPVGDGRLVRASRKDSVRFRDVAFMPNGDSLLGLSDETGELEFVAIPANGVGADRRLSNDGTMLRFAGVPSPNGRYVAYDDNNNDLWILDVRAGTRRKVSENQEGIGDFSWSPDSRWLAFAMRAPNSFVQIRLFSLTDGVRVPVTSDRVNSFSVAWDPGGTFLYFLSDRNLRSLVGGPWGARQPEPYFDRQIEIYHVALQRGVRSPFRPKDELGVTPAAAGSDPAERERQAPTLRIDTEGLAGRVKRVPVPPGNYSGLSVNDKVLFWASRGSGPDAQTDLMGMTIGNDDPEPVTMVADIRSAELSADGRKLLVRRGNALHVIDAKASTVSDLADSRVDLSGWSFPIDVREDWRQIFIDAWRLERDYFYDPSMHGVDWDATLRKYLPLVDRVTTRDELSDLIGRVVGELSALHTSVRGGDTRTGEDNVSVPTLGARLFRDPAAGGYRIDHIYETDPDYPDEKSPLADPDLDVHNGDVIVAVNGVATLERNDIGALLRNQAGRQVLITVKPGGAGADATRRGESRDVIVVPASNEYALRYEDWVYSRRQRVEEQGDGRIGYVYLSAMGGGNLTEWYRQFYPVFNRQGLIIDVRDNNGGNIDSFILEKLMRQAWMYFKDRVGQPTWNMQYAFRGHMVVLVDQNTASDGEAFADGFRRLGLGPVIGARTWGGEIWLSSVNRLTDGGLARAPMTGVYGPEGEWLIEQWGVVPDIVVDNLPHATFNGADAQLDAAVAYLREQIARDPRTVPAPPRYPNRGFDYRTTEDRSGGGRGGNR